MKAELKHQEVQSRTTALKKNPHGGVSFVDNRNTAQMKLASIIQRVGVEDEALQMKPINQMKLDDDELQMKPIVQLQSTDDDSLQGKFETIQQKPNNTGLPDNLKSGVESLSGFSMDDVRVHYNSDKPAQMQAHAYAQGTDIHVASGQETHLPHEAWHAVQQMQGRVRPTMQMQGVNVNDDKSLEKEADVMGTKAMQMQKETGWMAVQKQGVNLLNREANIRDGIPVQMQTKIQHLTRQYEYAPDKTETVGSSMEAFLDVTDPVQGSGVDPNALLNIMNSINQKHYPRRGHLLNSKLGGYGVADNLFPITASANALHSVNVETPIKNWLYAPRGNALAVGGVHYKVDVLSTFKNDGDPDVFWCRAEEWNPNDGIQGPQLLDTFIASSLDPIGNAPVGAPPFQSAVYNAINTHNGKGASRSYLRNPEAIGRIQIGAAKKWNHIGKGARNGVAGSRSFQDEHGVANNGRPVNTNPWQHIW